ncbi:MAG: hypothetical protein ABIJ00_05715 [Candidatus Eisenbacteria bacterium]
MTLRIAALAALAANLIIFQISPASAGSWTEDFTSLDYTDTLWTKAHWDTGAGELRLPEYEMAALGSCATGGDARRVAIAGKYAYIADGPGGLVVLQIKAPFAPIEIGSYDTDGEANDVAVAGDWAYVADGARGLVVIDISIASSPTLAGSSSSGGSASGIALAGKCAYVADGTHGLTTFDISVASNPVKIGSYDTDGEAGDVAVAGDRAYVADGSNGIVVLDISDPSSPTEVGSYDTDGLASAVAVSGDCAYVADGSNGIVVLDISVPSSPGEIGSCDTDGSARDVGVSGDHVYVADDLNGLIAMDVSDPSNPAEIGSFDTGGNAGGVAVAAEYACVANGTGGFMKIDIGTPVIPEEIGWGYHIGYAEGIAVSGDHAYMVSRQTGLVVFDISDPTNPIEVGSWYTGGDAKKVEVDGDYAYVAAGDNGLIIIDISTPSAPVGVGALVTDDPAYDVTISGDHAYVVSSYGGLVVVDISTPSSPVQVGYHDTDGIAIGIMVAGDHAYVADRDSGLIVFDISVPSNPAPVGSCDTYVFARDVAVSGDFAYIADATGGVIVCDVSDPTSPVKRGNKWTGTAVYSISLAGNYAYAANWYGTDGGLMVFDISDPVKVIEVASYVIEGHAKDIAVSGDLAFVTFDDIGIKIVNILNRFVDTDADAGQSLRLPVTAPADTIRSVRLTTSQTDSVTWEVSADSIHWQDTPVGVWTDLEWPETELYWRSMHRYTGYKINPAVASLMLEWLDAEPGIEAITDVPGDEGGWVSVRFNRSAYDFASEPDSIIGYGVWRRVDSGSTPVGFPPGQWMVAGSAPATHEQEYTVTAQTVVDSGEAGGHCSVFVVTAQTADTAVYYVSEPDSGVSVDNLAPSVPTGLMLADSLLSWDGCPQPDFRRFSVYGSDDGEFGSAVLIDQTVLPLMDVTDHPYLWYHVTATDSTGNESSDAALDASLTSVPDLPPGRHTYFLAAGKPNPFTSTTSIAFGLAERGPAHITVWDVNGRHVATLVDEVLPPGRHNVRWSGRSVSGSRVSPGLYFVMLRSASFTATEKILRIH